MPEGSRSFPQDGGGPYLWAIRDEVPRTRSPGLTVGRSATGMALFPPLQTQYAATSTAGHAVLGQIASHALGSVDGEAIAATIDG